MMKNEITIPLIAAGSALLGVIISQAMSLLLSRLDKRHKKQILLRQKYEEMMFYFQDSLLYIAQVNSCKDMEKLLALNNSPDAQRAIGLAYLYFPDFAQLLESYIYLQNKYYCLVLDSYDPNIPPSAGAQVRVHNGQKLLPIEKNLFAIKNEMLSQINRKVKKYTKA